MISFRWGLGPAGVVPPNIDPATWLCPTQLPDDRLAELLAPMRSSRDELKAAVPLSDDGFPQNSMALAYTPLVELDDRLWATSPGLVREQLRGGSWNRMRVAAKNVLGDSEEWLRAFGERFEEWCQFVAAAAAAENAFPDQLVPSGPVPGEEELGDVVMAQDGKLALFEAKATTIPARTSQEFTDASEILKWFDERFFFAKPKGNRRGGVLRQLDDRIKKIRQGHHASRAAPDVTIYPCVVTYEDLGEHAILYKWLDARCADEELLQDPNTAPVAIISVDDYQRLMSFGGGGRSVIEVLAQKATPAWRLGRLDELLWSIDEQLAGFHLPRVDATFNAIKKRILSRLYGAKAASLTTEEIQALDRLGYDPRWVAGGLLSPESLRKQAAELDTPDGDKNTEHYRAATLQSFLDSREELTDTEVDTILELGRLDPLESFRPNFAHSLVRFPGLTDQQFDNISTEDDSDGFRRVVIRERLLRRLSREEPSSALLDEAIDLGDAHVHTVLLDRLQLDRGRVEQLSQHGANRAVRNRAAQMLNRKRNSDDRIP